MSGLEQSCFINFPVLKGDPADPSSVQNLDGWTVIGTHTLSKNDVSDPDLGELVPLDSLNTDPLQEPDFIKFCQNKIFASSLHDFYPIFSRHHFLDVLDANSIKLESVEHFVFIYEAFKEKLAIDKARMEGKTEDFDRFRSEDYLLVREQKWEHLDDWAVAHNDSIEKKYTVTQGFVNQSSNTIENLTGLSFGQEDKTSTRASLGFLIKPKIYGIKSQFSGSLQREWSKSEKLGISKSLKMSTTDKKLGSFTETYEEKYIVNGGEKGARLVLWQLLDRFKLIRNYDQKIVADQVFRSRSEFKKYDYR